MYIKYDILIIGDGMTLEEKINKSNKDIEKLLNEYVNVKIICKINNKVLLDKNTLCLPSIIIRKGSIDNNIVYMFNELLNISINSISVIPFEKYNDYSKRYYSIYLDEEDIFSLNNQYTFETIDNMQNIEEKNIVGDLWN